MQTETRRIINRTALLLGLGLFLGVRGSCAEADNSPAGKSSALAFKAAPDGGFEFDTGVLRGKLRPGGKSLGLCSVVHKPSGTPLDRSNGLFSHYRVFTLGKRYGGGAWDWPSTASLRDDGAVEVQWPAADGRPFAMTARYRWHDPSTLDLETTVTANAELPQFESFLASYFCEPFTNCLVFVKQIPAAAGKTGFQAATKSLGDWQMFPRDEGAVALINDGRWKLEPNPVNWTIMPALGQPLGMRRAPGLGLAAVLMAPPADCFALATPQETEGHYSLYLSLFGRTVKAGETVRARARLVIGKDLSDQRALDLYQDYLKRLPRGR
jgi:hypothetical protein